jgi:hypothetical protein
VFTETLTSPAGCSGYSFDPGGHQRQTRFPKRLLFRIRPEPKLVPAAEGRGRWVVVVGIALGSGSIENIQCVLRGRDSSVVLFGGGITLLYHVQVKRAFSGDKIIWTNAYSVSSGKGSWWKSKSGDLDLTWGSSSRRRPY